VPRLTDARMLEIFPGSDFSDEERAFLAAMDRYKRERRRPFPTWHEVLLVARSLGYRCVARPQPLPSRRTLRRHRIGEGEDKVTRNRKPKDVDDT
jgi:hypothetical protein